MVEAAVRNSTINFGPQHPSPTVFFGWCSNWTARSSSVPIRILAYCIAAPKNS